MSHPRLGAAWPHAQLAGKTLHPCIQHVALSASDATRQLANDGLCCCVVSCRVKRIKVAAAAAQWASQQLAQQGQLLPPEGVRDAQGAVKPEQAMWLRAMLLLARTVHAAEATVRAAVQHCGLLLAVFPMLCVSGADTAAACQDAACCRGHGALLQQMNLQLISRCLGGLRHYIH